MHKYKNYFILTLLMSYSVLNAQLNQAQLYILHEGTMQQKGSLGLLNLNDFSYTHLDSVESFGNDLLVENDQIFLVDGAGNIQIYQRNPFLWKKSIDSLAARQIKKYQNQLVISCASEPYFKVYDLVGDSLLYSADTNDVRDIAEGLWVENDKAYILVNGFGSDSQLVIWNLLTKNKIKTLETAKNPNEFVKVGNFLVYNCLDYLNGTLTLQKLDLSTDSIVQTRLINIASYGGLTAKSNDEILFNNNDNWISSSIAKWNISSDMIDTHYVNMANAYALNYHQPSQTFFYSITDYSSFGSVKIQNAQIDTVVNTYISPRRLVYFDNPTTQNTLKVLTESLIYPNPAQNQVHFVLPNDFQKIEIYNLQGQKVYETNEKIKTLIIDSWERGVYMVLIKAQNGILAYKLLVE